MKILLIIKNFNIGGAETHVCELANNLVKQGHQVCLISRIGNQKQFLDDRVRHLTWKITDWNYFSNIKKIERLIEKEQFDIVHGHQRIAISMGAKAAKKMGVPVIATVHGQVKYDLRSAAIQKILDSVICVRETSFKETQASKFLKDKSILILNGVTQYTDKVARESFKLMYGSRLDKRHTWLLLLLINEVMPKLSERIPKIKLSIWGDGSERQLVEKAIAESDPKLAIEYHGFTNELGKEYKSATLALACARSAMDALVAGTNVLAVNYHHLGKVIDSKNYEHLKSDNFEAKGYEKPNAEALVQIILDFFTQIKNYQKEMDLLKSRIKEDLVIDTALKKLLCEYERLSAN